MLTARLIRRVGSVTDDGGVSSVVDGVRVLGTEAVHGMVRSLALGRIAVVSAPGPGTTFTVDLPRAG